MWAADSGRVLARDSGLVGLGHEVHPEPQQKPFVIWIRPIFILVASVQRAIVVKEEKFSGIEVKTER